MSCHRTRIGDQRDRGLARKLGMSEYAERFSENDIPPKRKCSANRRHVFRLSLGMKGSKGGDVQSEFGKALVPKSLDSAVTNRI